MISVRQSRVKGLVASCSNRASTGIVLLLLFSGLIPLRGQLFTGSINGVVTDPNGSAVPNAQLTVTNLATSAVRKTTSNSDGH